MQISYRFRIFPAEDIPIRYPTDTNPLELLLKEIEKSLRMKMYYFSVAMALTIPDICAALESSNGETSGARYKLWFENHLAKLYPMMTSIDCYSLRCGVIHQGRFGHPKSQYARVIFSLPTPSQNVFHNNVLNDALNLDAPTFCLDLVEAARLWFEEKKADPNVISNMDRFVQLRPQGLSPYMVGMPLIA